VLMDEIFGRSNFIASVIWQKVYAPKPSARHFSNDHDYEAPPVGS
jgi:adenine-specific DNA-methyltransferase